MLPGSAVARGTLQGRLVDYTLIGASARDIMLTHVFDMAVRRATRDVDVVVAAPAGRLSTESCPG
jgi:predicted nucleotidyltransferase